MWVIAHLLNVIGSVFLWLWAFDSLDDRWMLLIAVLLWNVGLAASMDAIKHDIRNERRHQ